MPSATAATLPYLSAPHHHVEVEQRDKETVGELRHGDRTDPIVYPASRGRGGGKGEQGAGELLGLGKPLYEEKVLPFKEYLNGIAQRHATQDCAGE